METRAPLSCSETVAPAESSGPSPDPQAAAATTWSPRALAGNLVEISSWSGSRALATVIEGLAPHLASEAAVMAGSREARGAGAALTWAMDLVWNVQRDGELAAWIAARPSQFFPPDAAAGGIDLEALPVVRAADASSAARAADKLLRSGAFAATILDLGPRPYVAAALLSRLLGLARKHRAVVVLLTEKPDDAPSLAPLVAVRLTAFGRRVGPDRFACTIEALKDKRRGPGWTRMETFRGPPGLR